MSIVASNVTFVSCFLRQHVNGILLSREDMGTAHLGCEDGLLAMKANCRHDHTVSGQKYSSRLENSIDVHVFSRLQEILSCFSWSKYFNILVSFKT